MPQSDASSSTPPPGEEKPRSSPFSSFGRKLDEHFSNLPPRVDEEVRKVITYLNDEVVPEVRRSSSDALRSAASHLTRLAEHLNEHLDAHRDSTRAAAPSGPSSGAKSE